MHGYHQAMPLGLEALQQAKQIMWALYQEMSVFAGGRER